jgi:parvulin-like peptidyl-prolyl isomerase
MLNLNENTMRYHLMLALASVSLWAQAPPRPAAAAPPQALLPPQSEVPDETVVAKVAGMDVTAGQIRKDLAIMPKEFIQLYNQNPKYAVQQLFALRYLAAEGEKAKLGEESPMKEQLAFMRDNALASAMVSHEHNFYTVTDQMINEFYEQNKARYQQAKIKVIYIAFKPGAPVTATVPKDKSLEEVARAISEGTVSKASRNETDARKLAEDLVKQIRGGADFAKLVADYSEDPTSKAAGGDFGVVNINSSYSPDVKKAVLALNAGDVTDPVRQASAFYIIRVEEKTVQPVTDLAGPIGEELRQIHLRDWLADVGKRFDPTVENVQFFTQPHMPVPGAPAPAPAPK